MITVLENLVIFQILVINGKNERRKNMLIKQLIKELQEVN